MSTRSTTCTGTEMTFELQDGTVVSPSTPLFITGSGRCGTTLMRRLIVERSAAVIPPENYALGKVEQFTGTSQEDWDQHCAGAIRRATTNRKNWRTYGIDAKDAIRLLSSIPSQERTTSNFWHAFHAIYAVAVGKPSQSRWGDKTPLNVDRVDHIVSIFPSARFVFMVRDVLDVTYSYATMGLKKREGNYLYGAKRWLDANENIKAHLEKYHAQTIVVRYEDLVMRPKDTVARVLDFAELPRSSGNGMNESEAKDITTYKHLNNALGEVRGDFIGKGRSGLPAEVREAIWEVAGTRDLQRFFGYSAD